MFALLSIVKQHEYFCFLQKIMVKNSIQSIILIIFSHEEEQRHYTYNNARSLLFFPNIVIWNVKQTQEEENNSPLLRKSIITCGNHCCAYIVVKMGVYACLWKGWWGWCFWWTEGQSERSQVFLIRIKLKFVEARGKADRRKRPGQKLKRITAVLPDVCREDDPRKSKLCLSIIAICLQRNGSCRTLHFPFSD